MPSPKVIAPTFSRSSRIPENVVSDFHLQRNRLIADFSKFKLFPICLRGEFNNHFKDQQHFCTVAAEFLGKILPKISSHTYSEICEGSQEGRILHFHAIDKSHQLIVQRILSEYGFPKTTIEQMTEGKDVFEFSAALGHTYAARVVCHKDENILETKKPEKSRQKAAGCRNTQEVIYTQSLFITPFYLLKGYRSDRLDINIPVIPKAARRDGFTR